MKNQNQNQKAIKEQQQSKTVTKWYLKCPKVNHFYDKSGQLESVNHTQEAKQMTTAREWAYMSNSAGEWTPRSSYN